MKISKKSYNVFRWILALFMAAVTIIVAYQVTLKVLGHSWTTEALLGIIFAGIIAGIVNNTRDLANIKAELQYQRKENHRFQQFVVKKFERIELRLDQIEKKLS